MNISFNRATFLALAVSVLLISFLSLYVCLREARAHDWYPLDCCGGGDCAEVERVTYDRAPNDSGALPILAVTTRHGTALVPADFPRRDSPDEKMHACMRPVRADRTQMRLVCLFVPPPS
jgi:hypothetical protein